MSWMHTRAMSPAQYKRSIAKFGLSENAAARFLGFSYSTARRIGRGEKEVPTVVALLLASMHEHDEMPIVPRTKRRSKLDATP